MANMTFKASLLPSTDLGYSLGSTTQKWNIYGNLTGNASTSSALNSFATIGSSSTTHDTALKNYFTSNYSSIPRNKTICFYDASNGNGSLALGYFLSGYDNNPYGGFFVAHYNTPYYVGIQSGTYTNQTILTSSNYTSYTVKKDGTGASGTWGISITGNAATSSSCTGNAATSSSCTGNAATATKLQTARKINGTDFDGTADITTANWGTARTLTIGNKGQSVDGSQNITWNLQDILIRASNEFNFTADGISGIHFNHKTQSGTVATTKITNYYFKDGQGNTTGVTVHAENFNGNAASAIKWATARTLTIGETGKEVDGTTDVTWEKAEILGESDTTKFYRGDQSWSNEISGGLFKVTNNDNTLSIGSQNTSYMHFQNSANIPFYFNKTIDLDGDLIPYGTSNTKNLGSSSKRWQKLYIGTADTYGSNTQPIWWNAGVPTAITYTANRLYYPSTTTAFTAGTHYVSDTKIAINSTSIPDEALYINGTSYHNGNDTHAGNINPEADNTRNLGASGIRWANAYITITHGDLDGNAATATKLSNTPNNTITFLRGDNTWTNTLSNYFISTRSEGAGFAAQCGGSDIRLYANTDGTSGLWHAAHGSGSAKSSIVVDSNNNINFYGTFNGKLGHTPNNTTTFLRGDNTWSNVLTSSFSAQSIELSFSTPFIDFHYNNSTADYTNRIIEDASGQLKITGKLKVGTGTNAYALNAASFICDSWVRSKGDTGWYNETHGGGIMMSDNTWVRISHSKRFAAENHIMCMTQNAGNAYNEGGSAIQIREVAAVGNTQSDWTYAPKIGFHWANRAAMQLGMDSSQYLRLYANNSQNYGRFRVGELYCQNPNGVRFCNGTSGRNFLFRNDGGNFWGLICTGSNSADDWITPGGGHPLQIELANGYSHFLRAYGAVWNDYAEYRKDNKKEKDIQEPGHCVKENGNGTLSLTTKRLERGCEIISDTFGFAIGQDKENGYDTPIASSGRVLAYPYESIEEFASHIGYAVCSGPNGTVSIMTDEEEEKYPMRAIGTISEIPNYEEWGTGKVKVNGRVWIRIR